MAILSVDLACRSWADLGVVVLRRAQASHVPGGMASSPAAQRAIPVSREPIECEILSLMDEGDAPLAVDPNLLAGRINHLCNLRGIRVVMLDGPQAWKSQSNGLAHSRVSERQLNTAGKTGLPGMVKPVTYRAFAEFCLDVYDALCRRGWKRLETKEQPGSPQDRLLVESYPHAAWKSLGLKPLPSKRRTLVSDLAEAYGALNALIPIAANRPPNHDQLQAIVGGLPGLALDERNAAEARIVGNPPRREGGHWREGFIVLPVPPKATPRLTWLDSMRWLD